MREVRYSMREVRYSIFDLAHSIFEDAHLVNYLDDFRGCGGQLQTLVGPRQ